MEKRGIYFGIVQFERIFLLIYRTNTGADLHWIGALYFNPAKIPAIFYKWGMNAEIR
ncbi:MAG: hypothetical protein ACI33P_05885 [Lysinibacillus sp.]